LSETIFPIWILNLGPVFLSSPYSYAVKRPYVKKRSNFLAVLASTDYPRWNQPLFAFDGVNFLVFICVAPALKVVAVNLQPRRPKKVAAGELKNTDSVFGSRYG
jgi:hypothetical protein